MFPRFLWVFWLVHAFLSVTSADDVSVCSGETGCTSNIRQYPIMELLHQPYLIDRNQPFVIKDSGSIVWPLSDHSKLNENLDFIFSSYGNASYEIRSSDCSCFGDDLDLCHREVDGLTYYSTAKQRQFGKRTDSFWFQYEVHSVNRDGASCIDSFKEYAPVPEVMDRIREYNEVNAVHDPSTDISGNESLSYNQMSFSFKIIEQNLQNGQLYVGPSPLSIPCSFSVSLIHYTSALQTICRLIFWNWSIWTIFGQRSGSRIDCAICLPSISGYDSLPLTVLLEFNHCDWHQCPVWNR